MLPKRALIALSHAIEDELCARAESGVLIGSFQRVRFYREAEERWREIARTADIAVALADFDEPRCVPGAPVELPLEGTDALLREWAVLCSTPTYSVLLAGVERPGQARRPDRERDFETVWTVDPGLVEDTVRACCDLIARASPRIASEIASHLYAIPTSGEDRFDVAAAVTSRMVAYLGRDRHDNERRAH